MKQPAMQINRVILILLALQCLSLVAITQNVYFIDGYHGGIYGHYPKQYTKFINETLDKNPDWKINLEIEPETWDSVKLNEPDNYATFKKYFADQSYNGRIEYVNPSYGQAYLYNINGESIIRQFSYGIKKLKAHFPEAVFTSYSSEEPCFTSALPTILSSFGFKYASLKNPNTCWGGYTRNFGGELINLVGPDGTKLITVPRYEVEALDKGSTWQTTASTNSTQYLKAAFAAGISNPIGMCLQDAGWKNGPWLGKKAPVYPTTYKTWRDYISNTVTKKPSQDWKFSQEDVQVSLVWGAQVLQKIAKEVRVSENKIGKAEKLNAMAAVYKKSTWPGASFDEAWRGLMLAQHHDCWIVPYNGRRGDTWIDKVATWTTTADRIADSAIQQSMTDLLVKSPGNNNAIRLYNVSAQPRNGFVKMPLPVDVSSNSVVIYDHKNIEVPSQLSADSKEIIFKATVPSVGYSTYTFKTGNHTEKQNHVVKQNDGSYVIETDVYRIVLDPAKGGSIKSLIAKKLNNKEFVDQANARSFTELRGYFYKDSAYLSSTTSAATINVIEDGAYSSKVEIKGNIGQHPFTQTIAVLQGEALIDMSIKIDWVGNPGIGDEYKQKGGYKGEDYRKAFYNDSNKLNILFPVNLSGQKIYKNAPFDVTESKLDNTFYQTWDSIKNNVILNWVDVNDADKNYGLAIFSDHTTGYVHGQNFPLGLTAQYSGVGLWGRNYSITGPTTFKYAILPHTGDWEKANIWSANEAWNNPLTAIEAASTGTVSDKSLISFSGTGLEITAVLTDGNDLLVRLFNPSVKSTTQQVSFDGVSTSIDLVELDGRKLQHLKSINKLKRSIVNVTIPKFGVRTIRLSNFKASVN